MAELAPPTQLPMQFANIPAEQPVRAVASDVQPFKPIDPTNEKLKSYALAEEFNKADKAQRDRADDDALQAALQDGGDLQTPDGVDKVVKKLKGKISPSAYQRLLTHQLDVQKTESQVQERLLSMDDKKLSVATNRIEFVVKSMSGLMDEYDKDAKGKDLASAVNEFDKNKRATLQALQQSGAIDEKTAESFMQMTPEQFRIKLKASAFVREQLKSAAELKRIEAQTKLYEGKADTEEAGGKTEIAIKNVRENPDLTPEEKKAEIDRIRSMAPGAAGMAKLKGRADEEISMDEKKLAVAQWIQNPSSLTRADPATAQSVRRWASDIFHISPEDMASGQAQRKFDLAAANTAGHRAGAMMAVEATMPKLIANAIESSDKVPRKSFVPYNELIQKADKYMSDPDLRDFVIKNQAVESEFQQVIARGGSNVASLQKAHDLVSIADSQETYRRAMAAMLLEMKANVEGAQQVRKDLGGSVDKKLSASPNSESGMRAQATGDMGVDPKALDREIVATTASIAQVTDESSKKILSDHLADLQRTKAQIQPAPSKVASLAAPGVPIPPPGAKPVNAKGWRLAHDKNGNWAYVGPNSEIEEVH